MSLASVSIVGNLVRAPEQMCFASGRVKTTMVVAINNRQKTKNGGKPNETTDFYKVETWGKLAELSSKFLAKGYQVTVTGRLVMDHWTDRHGNSRTTPVVEATQVAFPPKLRVIDTDTAGAASQQEIVNPIGGEIVMSDEEYEDADEEEDDDEDDCSYGYPNSKSAYKAAPQRGGPKGKNHAKLA